MSARVERTATDDRGNHGQQHGGDDESDASHGADLAPTAARAAAGDAARTQPSGGVEIDQFGASTGRLDL